MKETLEDLCKKYPKIACEEITVIYRSGYKNGFNDAVIDFKELELEKIESEESQR